MNLILFEPNETTAPLPRNDRRAVHLLDVLRRHAGDTFDAGLINGPRGKGTLVAVDEDTLKLTFVWGADPPPLDPITLLVGLPRPQTARKILQEATALGVARLDFVQTEKGDPNYANSAVWQREEWRRHVVAGAEQAFCTRLPEVSHGRTLAEALATLPAKGTRLALDNYESPAPLSQVQNLQHNIVLALGPERGWSAAERELLRREGFAFAHLGPRVLRVETACVSALAILKTRAGFW